jgi:hypothetical protein
MSTHPELEIKIRHGLDRDELLDLRDDIMHALARLGITLEMTCDGTTVVARHESTRPLMELIADAAEGASARVAAFERLVRVSRKDDIPGEDPR